MSDRTPLGFGAILVIGGSLSAVDHPVIDWFNRWVKSVGTNQRPSEIEMSRPSVLVGRVVGTPLVVGGAVIA
ncbi:hypothetical protein [Halovivax limisalsi]|uniref:hypothetical protein n=1 Tax=Halovivax limisalsi TaxID=1453760 RepID=UPI001FFDDBD4|nr:hypothetical protein [Halovivax limisalsi]